MTPFGHPARIMRAHIAQFRIPIRDAGVTQKINAVESLDEHRGWLRRLSAKYEQMRGPAIFAHNARQLVRRLLHSAELGNWDDKSDPLLSILSDARIDRG